MGKVNTKAAVGNKRLGTWFVRATVAIAIATVFLAVPPRIETLRGRDVGRYATRYDAGIMATDTVAVNIAISTPTLLKVIGFPTSLHQQFKWKKEKINVS